MNHESPGYDTTNEILTRMRMGIEFRWTVSIRDFTITVRPITMGETIEVMSNVADQMKRTPEVFRNRINENALLAKEHLILASTSKPGARDPRLTHALLNDFTVDELMAVYKEYISVTEKCDPSIETMPAEDLQQLVSDLKKSSPEALDSQLIELSFWQLKAVASFLINVD